MLTTKVSFLEEYPHLKEQWHPEKNKHLNPNHITAGSDIRAWWVCERGHEWDTCVKKRTKVNQGCPVCKNKKLHISNCLATVNPKVAKEWHPVKNKSLTPFDVIAVQNIKVWWKCKKEEDHEWEASVRHRNNGSGCHYCSKQKTLKKDSIAHLRLDLMEEWHKEKNKKTNPEEIAINSEKIVWWKCANGHEWKKKVKLRTNEQELFCPECKSLAFQRPDLAKEWSDKNNCSPKDVFLNSHKKVFWKCEHGHEWRERVDFRTGKQHASCPVCASIVCTHPHLIKEWDNEKNKGTNIQNVTQGMNQKFWWKCEFGHSWKTSVTKRAQRNQGCPHCSSSQTSFPEQYLTYALSTVFDTVENRTKINGVELDMYIPSIKVGIEYDGVRWHGDKYEKDILKNKTVQKENIHMIRIRENGLEALPHAKNFFITCYPTETDLNAVCQDILTHLSDVTKQTFVLQENQLSMIEAMAYITYKKKEESLEQTHPHLVKEWDGEKNGSLQPVHFTYGSGHKVWWKCQKGHSWMKQISKRSAGESCPYCIGRRADDTNNLLVQFPAIAKEWHTEKNKDIHPHQFTPKSAKKVWWMCEKEHEWEAAISSRTSQQSGCPYCSGRSFTKEKALASVHPALAKEWHPTKNGTLSPEKITYGSGKKVWWMCHKGHEWEASVGNRSSDGRGCPYCSGRKCTKENSLASVNPSLAKEWHPVKNKDLLPTDVSPFSNKRVWWMCKKGHEWETTVGNRSYGKGCKSCRNTKK